MRHALLFLLVIAAGASTAAPARFGDAPVSIEVIDHDGSGFPLYPLWQESSPAHQRAYLQAEPGARYALRVTNNTAERIGVVLTVDGRNVISGKRSELSPDERMYILAPWQSATYAGWRTGRKQVNTFYFTNEADSYAVAFGDDSALGVIALAAYREHRVSRRYGHSRQNRNAPHGPRAAGESKAGRPSSAAEATRMDDADAATGFGETRFSPSREVAFRPVRRALAKSFIKYAWASTLCDMGVIRCRPGDNRFWPTEPTLRRDGFAPPPPGYRGG